MYFKCSILITINELNIRVLKEVMAAAGKPDLNPNMFLTLKVEF